MATPTTEPSYEPAQQAESHLWDYVHVLLRRRRLVVAVFAAIVALATLRTLLTKPVYEATAQLLIEKQNPNVLNFQGVTEENDGGYGIDDYYQTQYKLLQSRSLARRVIEQLNLLNDPEYGGPEGEGADRGHPRPAARARARELEGAIGGFLGRTTVRPIRNSRLVNVSVSSGRPDLAATATNALAQLYIQQSLDLRFETSSEAGQWLGGQIEEQRKKAEEADHRLQALKRQEGLVNIEERRTLLDQRLKELGTALNERKTERLQKEALWRQMASAPNPEELPEVMRSGLVQNLRIELANLERQQAQLLERYLDQHPEVVKVRNQIQDTRTKIRSEAQRVIRAAENDYKAAAAQEASVFSALESAKQEALQLGARAVSYDTQKREVDAARQVLDGLMSRAKQTDVASELKSTNIRIVDPAVVPGGPDPPAEDARHRPRHPARRLPERRPRLLPRVPRQHPQDPGRRAPAPRGAPPGRRPGADRGRAPEPRRPQHRPRPALRRGLPRRPHRPQLLLERARLAHHHRHLHRPGRGQDPHRRQPRPHPRGAGGADPPHRRRPPQAHDAGARARQEEPGPLGRPRGQGQGLRGHPAEAQGHDTSPTSRAAPTSRAPPTSSPTAPCAASSTGCGSSTTGSSSTPRPWAPSPSPSSSRPLTDGVVVVAGAEMVPRKAVLHTLERLHDTGARILGVVLNRAQVDKHSYYYSHYYGHYYGQYYGKPVPQALRPAPRRPADAKGGTASMRTA